MLEADWLNSITCQTHYLDGVEEQLRDPILVTSQEMRLEHGLWSTEPLCSQLYDATVRKRVRFHVESSVVSEHFLLLDVVRHETKLLLYLPNCVEISGVVEGVAS